jgi:predicted CxxxxCH...CXXCH cytochrome family protein
MINDIHGQTGSSYSKGTSFAQVDNPTLGTCDATYCHGTTSFTWAVPAKAGSDACTICHGNETAGGDQTASAYKRAPGADGTGVDTAGDNLPSDAEVGAHQAHLTAADSISSAIACNQCHDDHEDNGVTDAGHIDDALPADMTWGTIATGSLEGPGTTPNWTGTQCSTTYCHNGLYFKNEWGSGTGPSPNWTDTSYINSFPADCGKCHGSPPGGGHPAALQTECTNCHDHVNAAGDGFDDETLHVNGTVEGGGTCTDCHDTGGAGTTGPNNRRAIVPEFGLAWSHKRTAGGTVTPNDCGVCHTEGDAATGNTTANHQNGVVDLRDPDTGSAITGFADFTRDTSSAALEAWVTNVMNNLCLKCHDGDGAVDASARVPGGTAMRPFGTAPAHTPGNNVLDVDAMFDTTNATFHPIKGPQNNPYANVDTMVAPWDTKAAGSGSPVDGPVISCWDCHEALNTAHGGAVTLRAPWMTYASSATDTGTNNYEPGTLCFLCHQTEVYGAGGGGIDGLSAFDALDTGDIPNFDKAQHGNDGRMPWTCVHCHGSSWADPGRPTRAEDAHGFNTFKAGGVAGGGATSWPNSGSRPYAFLRMDKPRGTGTEGQWKAWRPKEDGATSNPDWGCNWQNADGLGACNRSEHETNFMSYGPGGIY